ncbi:hypothetical protein CFB50_34020 [Burkholderia sp. AU33423]|uniref:hypothetical protein n=1 Tax=Burkholderia sp. AU33423 TaxID=2015355 RepID=UPI000B7A0734|nr:hypothetical protein [Burkholderia sp. AU33423]OXI78717.1 hypothetical protein CFB50_34020 [Burkholderia sp. AU33423]
MTQYTVTIVRQVKNCQGALNGTVSVSAVPAKRLDEDQQYTLFSSGVWATSDITSTLTGDGTSTGLNAHSEDQTAAAIGSAVSFLSAISLPTRLERGASFTCSDDIEKAQANLKGDGKTTLKQRVDQETQDVARLTAKVTQLTTLFQSSQGKHADRTALTAAMTKLAKAQDILNTDQARLNASLKAITDTQIVVWPLSAKESLSTAPFELDQSVAQSWVKWSGLPKDPEGKELPPPPLNANGFKVWLALYRADGSGGWQIPETPPMVGNTDVGVPVRVPRLGRLLACSGKPCESKLTRNWGADETHSQLIAPDGPVLQFGQLYSVPVTGGIFKSEGAVIALDANGVPTSIQVTEKAAAAAVAAGVAQSAAATISDIPAKIAAAKLAKTQVAISQAKADNDLAAAKASASTAGETAAANAQLAYVNATNSLATANANAQAAGELGALAAQTALAQQQLALRQQQAALASAKANAAIAPAVDALNANTTLVNAKATNINAQVALTKAEQAVKQP